jgi:serine/threonine protein kinase
MRSIEKEKRPYCDEVLKSHNQWLPGIEIMKEMEREIQKNDSSISKSGNKKFYLELLRKQIRLAGSSQIELMNLTKEFKNEYTDIAFMKKGNFSILFKTKTAKKMETKVIKFFPLKVDKIEEVKLVLEKIKSFDKSYIDMCNSFVFENNYLKELFENFFDDEENESLMKDANPEFFFSKKKQLLRLEMEYYPYTLKDVSNQLSNEFNSIEENIIPIIWFYVAAQLFFQITECLDYLHNREIIHRDLKPSNILISNDISNDISNRYVKLTDIGLSNAYDLHITISYSNMSETAKYIDFLSVIDDYFGKETDIYSLGIIILELFNINEKKLVLR